MDDLVRAHAAFFAKLDAKQWAEDEGLPHVLVVIENGKATMAGGPFPGALSALCEAGRWEADLNSAAGPDDPPVTVSIVVLLDRR